jgi:hypothetical protein
MVQLMHPPQKLEPKHSKVVEAMGLKKYRFEVPITGVICLQNFMKIYQSVQTLLGEYTQTDEPMIR